MKHPGALQAGRCNYLKGPDISCFGLLLSRAVIVLPFISIKSSSLKSENIRITGSVAVPDIEAISSLEMAIESTPGRRCHQLVN